MEQGRPLVDRVGARLLLVVGLLWMLSGTSGLSAAGGRQDAAPAEPIGTAGELQDRIGAAWDGVRTVRAISTATTTELDGEPPDVSRSESSQEAILPDRLHVWTGGEGPICGEIIVVAGRVYVRGDLSGQGLGSTPFWTEIDPARIGDGTAAGFHLAQLAAPVTPPLSELSRDERRLPVEEIAPLTIAGRRCAVYRIVAPADSSSRVELNVALADDGLPCRVASRVEISGIRVTTVTTFLAYDEPLTIEPPVARA